MATEKTASPSCPTARPTPPGSPPRQQRVLEHIKDSIEKRGYPPSMREIGEAVGLTSSSSVAHQLKVLEEKGFLKRDPNRPRALEVFLPEVMAARRSIVAAPRSRRTTRPASATRCPPRPTSRSSAGSPPVARSWPRSGSRTSSRCPSSWSATAAVPARGLRRLDDRRRHLQRRLRRDPPAADRRERRDRRRA